MPRPGLTQSQGRRGRPLRHIFYMTTDDSYWFELGGLPETEGWPPRSGQFAQTGNLTSRQLAAEDLIRKTAESPQNLGPSNNHQQLETLASTPELEALGYCEPKVPNEMLCPISTLIMDNPVYLNDDLQHAFERSHLLEWFKINATDPLTGKPTDPTKIKSADLLKRAIDIFLACHTQRKRFYERDLQPNQKQETYLNQYQAATGLKDQATPPHDDPRETAGFRP